MNQTTYRHTGTCDAPATVSGATAVAERLLEKARRTLKADAVALYAWDPALKRLRMLRHQILPGFPAPPAISGARQPQHIAFQRGAPVVFVDFKRHDDDSLTSSPALETVAAVPITSEGRPIGALLVQSFEGHLFGPAQISRLSKTAQAMGGAVQETLAGVAVRFDPMSATHRIAGLSFKELLDSAPDAVIIADGCGRIVLTNRQAEAVFGYRPGELAGQPVEILLSARARQAHVHHRAAFVKAPQTRPMGSNLNLVAVRKDGTEFPVEISLSPVSSDGESLVISIVRDMTDRRLAERALRDSEERYRDLVETSLEMIWTQELDGRILSANPAMARNLGLSRRRLPMLSILDILAPSVRHRVPHRTHRLKEKGSARGFMRVITRTGEERIWEYTATLRTVGVEKPVVRTLARDVTERRRHEAALKHRESWFRALTENAADLVFVLDETGRIRYVSPASWHILSCSPETLLGSEAVSHVHPDDQRDFVAALGAIARQAEGVRFEFRLQHLTRGWRHVEAVGKNSLGNPSVAGIVINTRDITSRRRNEQQLRLLGSAIANTSEGILIATPSSPPTAVYVNDGFCRLNGCSREDLLRTGPPFLKKQTNERPEFGLFRRAITKGQPFEGELVLPQPDGTERNMELHATPVPGPDGKVAHVVVIQRDVTERRRAEEALAHQALHDVLTDLPNRTLLRDRVDQAIVSSRRKQTSAALFVMDLDRFKEVNDTFGHHCGDLLLRQIGPRLRAVLRESDTIARMGGDEFAMVLTPVEGARGAELVAQKMQKALEEPFTVDGHELDVRASMGIAICPTDGIDGPTLLRHADVAMYRAKRSREGYALYNAASDDNNSPQMALIGELRQGIARNELVLHHQPKISLETGRIMGVEALVRWQHPRLGLMGPDQFVGLAEQSGLIQPLTHWLIEAALAQCRKWSSRGWDFSVAVNLSMHNLHDPQLPDTIASLLKKWDVSPARLTAEITEGTLMADPDRAMAVVTRLSEMGLPLSIDDFGTGYSSLSYLKRLPVREIKIDRSFVTDMLSDDNDAVIVRSTIELAHNLGLKVVAEGVETSETYRSLTSLRCDTGQGYFFGHPMAPSQFNHWIQKSPWGKKLAA